ncbi:zinc finger protein 25-like [Centruroides vittatus]|uniref:zinc finger protein 25-like n=1 Tax=Centruroides vittatus TaxID=120091 RepID=UPI003510A6BA
MPPKQFSCVHCDEKLGSRAKLQAHLKRHQIEKQDDEAIDTVPEVPEKQTKFPCNTCDRILTTPASLKRHQNSCNKIVKMEAEEIVTLKMEFEEEEFISNDNNHIEKSEDTEDNNLANPDSLRAHMRDKITNRVQSLLDETRSRRRISNNKCKECGVTMRKRSKDERCTKCKNASKQNKQILETNELGEGKCVECDLTFPDKKALIDHNTSLHSTAHQCVVCKKTFSRKYHLYRHLQITACSGLPPPSHKCQVCGKIYTRKDNLREHLRAHAGEVARRKKYKCEYCDKQFHGTSLLKIHIRTHTGERPFSCEFCSKTFPSGGGLAKHRRIHTGEKPYVCTECGCKFTLKGTLNRHMRIHTGVRPHKCEFCGKQFIQAGGLKAHLFYHTGQNGFRCEQCGKTFNRKARLQMHMNYVHNKIKPFECQECGKCFTRKEDLARHYVLHTGEKPFQCPTCSKCFAIKPSLKLHLLTHTKEEPRSCHECGRAFIRKDCLLRHMRKRHRDLLDKILISEKDKKFTYQSTSGMPLSRTLNEQSLCESIRELLSLLVDEPTLKGFGWPDKPVDEVLESVIRRCGHTPVTQENYSYLDRLRENSKLLFTVVIDDNAVKTLLNNQTVDEVILHVLRLARS